MLGEAMITNKARKPKLRLVRMAAPAKCMLGSASGTIRKQMGCDEAMREDELEARLAVHEFALKALPSKQAMPRAMDQPESLAKGTRVVGAGNRRRAHSVDIGEYAGPVLC